jgi:hypothetical protein
MVMTLDQQNYYDRILRGVKPIHDSYNRYSPDTTILEKAFTRRIMAILTPYYKPGNFTEKELNIIKFNLGFFIVQYENEFYFMYCKKTLQKSLGNDICESNITTHLKNDLEAPLVPYKLFVEIYHHSFLSLCSIIQKRFNARKIPYGILGTIQSLSKIEGMDFDTMHTYFKQFPNYLYHLFMYNYNPNYDIEKAKDPHIYYHPPLRVPLPPIQQLLPPTLSNYDYLLEPNLIPENERGKNSE